MTRVHLALPSSLQHFWRLGADTSIQSVFTALTMAEQLFSVGRFPVLIMRLCLANKTVKGSHAMLIAVFGEYFPADCEPPSFSSIWQPLPATEAAGRLQTVWVLSPKSTNITLTSCPHYWLTFNCGYPSTSWSHSWSAADGTFGTSKTKSFSCVCIIQGFRLLSCVCGCKHNFCQWPTVFLRSTMDCLDKHFCILFTTIPVFLVLKLHSYSQLVC